jgi:hypothetical protein
MPRLAACPILLDTPGHSGRLQLVYRTILRRKQRMWLCSAIVRLDRPFAGTNYGH